MLTQIIISIKEKSEGRVIYNMILINILRIEHEVVVHKLSGFSLDAMLIHVALGFMGRGDLYSYVPKLDNSLRSVC